MDQPVVAQFIERLASAFAEDDTDAAGKATEAANVRRVQETYRALASGDMAAFLETLAEDMEMEFVGSPNGLFAGRYRGREESARAVVENFAKVEEQRPEIHWVVAQGDVVIVVGQESGRIRRTGLPYDSHFVQVFTFRDGKMARYREIYDSTTMTDT
jgi:uncharacterized protein